jgi:IS1 family transposase
LNNIETVNEGYKGNKVKKMKEEKIKKKNFSKQNTNIYGDDKNIIESKLKRGRNNYNELEGRQNNSVAYHHDMNLSKNEANSKLNKNNTKQLKSEKNKKLANYKTQNLKKNVVQNLMTDFDQTMEEYSSLYGKHNATTTKGVKGANLDSKSKLKSSKNKIKSDSKSRIKGSVDQRQFKKK